MTSSSQLATKDELGNTLAFVFMQGRKNNTGETYFQCDDPRGSREKMPLRKAIPGINGEMREKKRCFLGLKIQKNAFLSSKLVSH